MTNSKKILLCSYSPQEQLVVVLAGKQRHIKLIPTRGLDHESTDWIKVTETKGATTFALVNLETETFICVAIRKTLLIYQVNRKKTRYTFWREVQMPVNIQNLTSHNNMIAVGTNSNFVVYHVNNREQTPICECTCSPIPVCRVLTLILSVLFFSPFFSVAGGEQIS
jgi:ureidoglycolate hydrolase